jgi:nitrogen regulatory protein PII
MSAPESLPTPRGAHLEMVGAVLAGDGLERIAEIAIHLRPKLKIEIVVDDEAKALVVETILRHARTGSVGDGKIFVMPVEEAIRIRTGEAGGEVLQAHPEGSEVPA